MELYLGAIFFAVCLAWFIVYRYTLRQAPSSDALVLVTRNCEDTCEGIVKEALLLSGNLYVIDRSSTDQTYKILEIMACKYGFSLIRCSDERQSISDAIKAMHLAKSKILFVDKATSYVGVRTHLTEMRQFFTKSLFFR